MFVGIDLGTSAVKLLLMDEAGRVAGTQSEEYPLLFPKEGFSEQDPAAGPELFFCLLYCCDHSRVSKSSVLVVYNYVLEHLRIHLHWSCKL